MDTFNHSTPTKMSCGLSPGDPGHKEAQGRVLRTTFRYVCLAWRFWTNTCNFQEYQKNRHLATWKNFNQNHS